MTLGIDASILYGLGRTSGVLHASELAKDTPYNTRLHAGLPPTPISSPGDVTLQAALNPAAVAKKVDPGLVDIVATLKRRRGGGEERREQGVTSLPETLGEAIELEVECAAALPAASRSTPRCARRWWRAPKRGAGRRASAWA